MSKISYNLAGMSSVTKRGINEGNVISDLVNTTGSNIMAKAGTIIYKNIDDVIKINGTFMFTVDKYIESSDNKYYLNIRNKVFECVFANYFLDINNVYIATYIGNNTFSVYKLDSDESPILSTILSLMNRVTTLESVIMDMSDRVQFMEDTDYMKRQRKIKGKNNGRYF